VGDGVSVRVDEGEAASVATSVTDCAGLAVAVGFSAAGVQAARMSRRMSGRASFFKNVSFLKRGWRYCADSTIARVGL